MSLKPKTAPKKKQHGLSRKDLKRIHEKRSKKAQEVDGGLQASMAPSLAAWAKDPDKYDVSGIDFPEEWRTKDEIERLQNLDEYLPSIRKRLKEAKESGKPLANLEETLKLYSTTQTLLKWQKKHPFLSAGVDTDPAGYGKKNYEMALKNKIDYGFNLRDPENSFLHNYHLKKHDIKGMRVILEKNMPKFGEASAWYNRDTKLFHQTPRRKGEKRERTDKVILHEIGHHVMFSSPELWSHWIGQDYTFRYPVRFVKKKMLTGEIRRVHLRPYEMIWQYQKYFGGTVYFDAKYNLWRGRYLNEADRKESGLVKKWTQQQEVWAETFAQYRLGNISRDIKLKKARIDMTVAEIKTWERKMKHHKGPKNRKPYTKMKFVVKQLEIARVVASAEYNNLLKFNRMLKRWDKRGWNPDYDEEMKLK